MVVRCGGWIGMSAGVVVQTTVVLRHFDSPAVHATVRYYITVLREGIVTEQGKGSM